MCCASSARAALPAATTLPLSTHTHKNPHTLLLLLLLPFLLSRVRVFFLPKDCTLLTTLFGVRPNPVCGTTKTHRHFYFRRDPHTQHLSVSYISHIHERPLFLILNHNSFIIFMIIIIRARDTDTCLSLFFPPPKLCTIKSSSIANLRALNSKNQLPSFAAGAFDRCARRRN